MNAVVDNGIGPLLEQYGDVLKDSKKMTVTILEELQSAAYNMDLGLPFFPLSKEQLHNAITLLEKGYDIYDGIGPLLEQYGDVENVPEKEE